MSCNGCRVLRKGCSDSCILRPCLQWIETAEAQGHATVFVAKFFGRAGLMGFIGAVPESQRPALFQSLLYEACGRTVNPVHGAVGLLWTGYWHVCQAAVETILKGGTLRPSASLPAGATTSQCLAGVLPSVQIPKLAAVPERTIHLSSSPLLSLVPSAEAPKSKRLLDEPHNGTIDWSVTYTDRGKRCRSIESESVADCPGQQNQQQHHHTPPLNFPGSTNQSGFWAPQRQLFQGAAPDGMERIELRKSEQCQHAVGQHIAPVPVSARPCTGEIDTSGSFNDQGVVALYSDSIALDLTLNSNPIPSQRTRFVNARVSSPNSTISVSSEGSVTSLDTADLPICRLPLRPPSPNEEHRLLDLLV